MSNRTISWSAALRDLKADRSARTAIREERLRFATGSRGGAALSMSGWRGCSGRRYVVVVQTIDSPDLTTEDAAVILAVSRDAEGRGAIIAVRSCEAGDPGFLGWLAACACSGAHEVHAHRLGKTAAERSAIAADLTGPIDADIAPFGRGPR